MFRGHAFARILSSHKECAWDKGVSNNADTEAVNPLDWLEVLTLIMLLKNGKYGMIFGYIVEPNSLNWLMILLV